MRISVTSPVDGSTYLERETLSEPQLEQKLQAAEAAQPAWASRPLEERLQLLRDFVARLLQDGEQAAGELTHLMGRPISQAGRELDEFAQRARRLLDMAPARLSRRELSAAPGSERFSKRTPVGVVLVRAGWNYPYIIAAHTVISALAAGNAVLLKPSLQTPLCGERLERAFLKAGGPAGVLQTVLLAQPLAQRLTQNPRIGQVAVTGVMPRTNLKKAGRIVGVGLDLGGKDSAYVRPDADIERAAAVLCEGGFYNAGQSCCGVERVFVHRDVYGQFVEALRAQVEGLVFGDPTEPSTTLGPMVRFQAALAVHKQVSATLAAGARALLPHQPPDRAYLAPQLLVDVTPDMPLMTEETFGPAMGIMQVDEDDEAICLMNQSPYALASAIWTQDLEQGRQLADRLDTNMVLVNHCNYLEPAIAWLGLNDSGYGFTLSGTAFGLVTKTRTYHICR